MKILETEILIIFKDVCIKCRYFLFISAIQNEENAKKLYLLILFIKKEKKKDYIDKGDNFDKLKGLSIVIMFE